MLKILLYGSAEERKILEEALQKPLMDGTTAYADYTLCLRNTEVPFDTSRTYKSDA